MEKKGQIIEMIIKMVLAIIAAVSIVTLVVEIVSMFSLFSAFSQDEEGMMTLIYNSPIGPIYKSMGMVDVINNDSINKALVGFASSISVYAIINLIAIIALLITNFIFIKWELLTNYLKMYGFIVFAFLLKYVLFGLQFVLFFKDDMKSVAISVVMGTIFFIFLALVEIFIFTLMILKFVLNVKKDMYELKYLSNL